MVYYAVIDTNVLVSALLAKSAESAVVQVMFLVLSGQVVPIYSSEILAEYKEVLKRRKFGFARQTIDYLIAAVEKFGIYTESGQTAYNLPDMKDLPFYEIVMDKRGLDAYLVTGNIKHFPKQPFIVTAREFLNIIGYGGLDV